jgi:hypothetical protein
VANALSFWHDASGLGTGKCAFVLTKLTTD